MPNPILPLFEALETRQMLAVTAPILVFPSTTDSTTITYAPMAKSVKKVKAQAADPLIAFYSGQYTIKNQYAGAFTLAIQEKVSNGNYFGYLGFENSKASARMNVQIRATSAGRITVNVVSATEIIRISGQINARSGQLTGTFQTWSPKGTTLAQITLNRSQTPSTPRAW